MSSVESSSSSSLRSRSQQPSTPIRVDPPLPLSRLSLRPGLGSTPVSGCARLRWSCRLSTEILAGFPLVVSPPLAGKAHSLSPSPFLSDEQVCLPSPCMSDQERDPRVGPSHELPTHYSSERAEPSSSNGGPYGSYADGAGHHAGSFSSHLDGLKPTSVRIHSSPLLPIASSQDDGETIHFTPVRAY